MRVAALAKQEEGAGDNEYAPVENAAVPLLSHMKSGPMICRELGFSLGGSGGSFSALAAAAEAEMKRSDSCSSMGGSTSTAAVSTEDAILAHATSTAPSGRRSPSRRSRACRRCSQSCPLERRRSGPVRS